MAIQPCGHQRAICEQKKMKGTAYRMHAGGAVNSAISQDCGLRNVSGHSTGSVIVHG